MKIKTETHSLEETDSLAKAFSKVVSAPMVILLNGDLGSGKTTFVKSLAKYLGSGDLVTSPTFTLLNIYNASVPIYHFDMYRLSSMEEAYAVGFEEYFDKSKLDGVCLVEWAENVDGLIKDVDYVINITKKDDFTRIFEILEEKK